MSAGGAFPLLSGPAVGWLSSGWQANRTLSGLGLTLLLPTSLPQAFCWPPRFADSTVQQHLAR